MEEKGKVSWKFWCSPYVVSFKWLFPFSIRALFNPTFATKLDLNIPPAYGLTSPTLSVVSGQSCEPPALISQPPPSLSTAPKMLTFKDMDDLTSVPLVLTKFDCIIYLIIYTRHCAVAMWCRFLITLEAAAIADQITEPVDFRMLFMHGQVHTCSARYHRAGEWNCVVSIGPWGLKLCNEDNKYPNGNGYGDWTQWRFE